MKITDGIYGTFSIGEPVIIDLINSPAMQRLKDISQLGIPDRYYHLKGFSRYDHSIGVFLLLRSHKASIAEQIAGLIHDISHTPFSHVIDWVINGKGGEELHQDDRHAEFLHNSEIPGILASYGISIDVILENDFGLLEREIPDICADRIDYALREFSNDDAHYCLNHLTVRNGSFAFDTMRSARLFAIRFLERQERNWGSYEATSRYKNFAEMFRYAVESNILSIEELLNGKETAIIEKLESAEDWRIRLALFKMTAKSLDGHPIRETPEIKKFRHVDPLFVLHRKLVRLSDADPGFKELLEAARERNKKGVRTAIIF